MKKHIIILSFVVLANFAMGQVFTEKSSIISAGIGIPNVLKSTLSEFGVSSKGGPVIYGSYEHALSENWGLGALVGHASVELPRMRGEDEEWSILLVGIKADYHFGNDNIDAYAGAALAYVNASFGEHDGFSTITYYPHVGIRLPFTKNFGAFAEVGYGISILNLGVSIMVQ